jgi:hypothetical protein
MKLEFVEEVRSKSCGSNPLCGFLKNFIEKPVAFLPELFTFASYFLPKFKFLIAENSAFQHICSFHRCKILTYEFN